MNSIRRHIQSRSWITWILLWAAIPLSAQLSPGELSSPHAHLEGMSNCVQCHVLRKQVSNRKCLDCHKEIDSRIKASRGYHVSADVKGKECASCHNDHHGRNFQMIRFDKAQFDHTLAGYDLQGAHGRIDCEKCHQKENISDQKLRDRTGTYLGLGQECASCHDDFHRGTLGVNCASCHDYERFRPAPGFSHDRSDFKLLGAHLTVECAKCHRTTTRQGKEFQQFSGVNHDNCTSCHRDVHENRFGPNCTKCHSETSFRQIKNTGNFNHTATGFPLKGKHASVSCTSCHSKGYSVTLKHSRCTDCHKDYHRAQFRTGTSAPDCSECHTEQGFSPTLYTLARHNNSPFSLSGAHLAVPCFDCHRKNDRWEFRQIGKACSDCHEDIHSAVLDPKYYPGKQCTTCHTNDRWSDIAFDHALTGYRLEGAHAKQSCRVCHVGKDPQDPRATQFSNLNSDCLQCHREVHNGQFGSQGTSCQKCHDYFDWKAGLFNHNLTAFPLDGKHKNVACAKCHPRVTDGPLIYTRYKPIPTSCESCH